MYFTQTKKQKLKLKVWKQLAPETHSAMANSSNLRRLMAAFALVFGISDVWLFRTAAFSLRHKKLAVTTPRAIDVPSTRPCRLRRRGRAGPVVLRALSDVDGATWKSCAPPRFDAFASCIVGPWVAAAAPSSPSTTQEVEEVMRSCGGAVQGVRELPLSSLFGPDSEEERAYHNRADDGFVYADDGSYSAGPERWDWKDASSGESGSAASSRATLWMASLAFPNAKRMWLAAELSEASLGAAKSISDKGSAVQHVESRALELHRPSQSMHETSEKSREARESNPPQVPNVLWKVIQRARMPSPTQSWTLARSKWEKQIVADAEAVGGESEEAEDATLAKASDGRVGSLVCWTFVEYVSEQEGSNIFPGIVHGDAIHLHMTAACPVSRVARSTVRCYDGEGSLKGVAFLEGTLSNASE